MKFDCILADDDELAKITLEFYVKKAGIFNIIGSFSSANEVLEMIEKGAEPEILFLDIDMPGISGLKLRQKLPEIPVCVFISSHPDYALESFDLETLDFIQKPLVWDRFKKTTDRIQQYFDVHKKAELYTDNIGGEFYYTKVENEQVKIKLEDIIYIEAKRNYTLLVTDNKSFKILKSFGSVLEEDIFNSFIQVHRSFAVQNYLIKKISGNYIIMKNDIKIPVGRSFKNKIKSIFQC